MAGLESRAHHLNVTRAVAVQHVSSKKICKLHASFEHLQGVVKTTVRDLHEVAGDVLALWQLSRVDELCRTHLHSPVLLGIVSVDGNATRASPHGSALEDSQTNTADTKDGNVVAGLNISRFCCCAHTSGDTAAEETGLLERSLVVDFDNREFGDDRVLTEGAAAHEVKELWTKRKRLSALTRKQSSIIIGRRGLAFAVAREARGAIRQLALALSSADSLAQVGLSRLAEL